MRLLLLLVVLLLAGLHGFADERLYKSNDFGMLLAPIQSSLGDEYRWVVRVRRSGSGEDRLLYDNGKEVRRWQISWNAARTEKTERETAKGLLVARRVYDGSGSLLQEEEYAGSALTRKSLYTYEHGTLTRKRVLGNDGREISSELYFYSPEGGLREVRRAAAPDETATSWVVNGPAGMSEERTSREAAGSASGSAESASGSAESASGSVLFIERYGVNGRMVNRERRDAGKVASVEDFKYDSTTGALVSSEEKRPPLNTLIDRRYDAAGRLSTETTRVKGEVTQTDAYERDEKGRVTAKTRRSSAGLEVWKYSYGDSDNVAREEYFQRGMLQKVVTHGEGKLRTEELYRDGELFLKVFYDGDTRLREEVWSNGSIQRERKYP